MLIVAFALVSGGLARAESPIEGEIADIEVEQIIPDGMLATVTIRGTSTTAAIMGQTKDSVVDGTRIRARLYRCGRYQFQTVLGALRTVPRYAISEEAARRFLEADSKQ